VLQAISIMSVAGGVPHYELTIAGGASDVSIERR
jgi:hypothetical protein